MADHEIRTAEQTGTFGKLISFRGDLGRLKFLLWLVGEIALLVVGFAALAGLNNPTGGGSALFAVVFPLAALYLHLCLVVARLRNAGATYPVPLGIFVAILPFLWLGLTFELFNSYWLLVLGGFALFYLGPAMPAGKTA